MSLKQADLVTEIKASLQDSRKVFDEEANDAAFIRFLDRAAMDLTRYRPRKEKDSVTLTAKQAEYDAPADIIRVISVLYGRHEQTTRQPWETNYPTVPTVQIYRTATGKKLILNPAPTTALINNLGDTYEFLCSKRHVVSDVDPGEVGATTVDEADRGLLLLRAEAEAMKEMAMRNITKPVALQDNIGGVTRNGTPAALHKQLLDEFERLAR